ncbi:universal stress protein [Halococcoides cellulosivorans]|uniref:Universal stress protein n=1 Tax=Halococcoides cellulosivorans TaxID=1679096 RepID=A0A2R4X118_9EURY|nr:universal stress protein [Halococcoides cellulosivorans]AWB27475.1 universal stress protein [Halococcoides cellulosivorans]
MYDRILVPTDGSTGTARTLEHAASIANAFDASVDVLYVLDERMYQAASEDATEDVIRSLEEEGDRAIDDAVTRLEDDGVEATGHLERGIPYRDIIAFSEDNAVDLIVMGTHGRSGRDRLAKMGSVTDRVVKNADVPVMVVDIEA